MLQVLRVSKVHVELGMFGIKCPILTQTAEERGRNPLQPGLKPRAYHYSHTEPQSLKYTYAHYHISVYCDSNTHYQCQRQCYASGNPYHYLCPLVGLVSRQLLTDIAGGRGRGVVGEWEEEVGGRKDWEGRKKASTH